MPKATPTHTTSSRRGLLARSTAALLAGAAAATVARAAPLAAPVADGDEAEMILLCERLIALEAKRDNIFLAVEDDDEAERQSGLLTPERNEIRDRLYAIAKSPTSDAGRRAFARAALATSQRDADGIAILDGGPPSVVPGIHVVRVHRGRGTWHEPSNRRRLSCHRRGGRRRS